MVRSTTCPEGSEKRLEGTVEDGGTSITTKSKVKSSINGKREEEDSGFESLDGKLVMAGWVAAWLYLVLSGSVT